MPLQISILNPLTSWTRNDPLAALKVKNSVTVFTLTSSVQIEGIHRLLVEPASDSSGGYHGSCRIAVDAQGELQRLFHAHAPTESATLEELLQQVRHWQQQVSVRITANSTETLSY